MFIGLLVILPGLTEAASFTHCGETDVPGDYVTHVVRPSTVDERTTGKNSYQLAYVSSTGPWRNELVVFFPGTTGVPVSFENFCQNAANQGYHVIALTYENDQSMQSLCGMSEDPRCYRDVRAEVLTGEDRSRKVELDRPNSIEFRLAAFLNYLERNHPNQQWGQYLTDQNSLWTDCVDWSRLLLCGHSQGAGYAAFAGTLHETRRVVMMSGGDYRINVDEPAPWLFEDPATPKERWFQFQHYHDTRAESGPGWEALDLLEFGPVVDVDTGSPPYEYSHVLVTFREPCPTVDGKINYHNAVANDPLQKRDANGVPYHAAVWTHLLNGPTSAPEPEDLVVADSVRDFQSTQTSAGWRYGYWNTDGTRDYKTDDFRLFSQFGQTKFAIPAWKESGDERAAIWETGARPRADPEIWPIRRWVSSVGGPVVIRGALAKWDILGGDGVSGAVVVDGDPVWQNSLSANQLTGVSFEVEVEVSLGSTVDFVLTPGRSGDATADGALFSARVLAAPPVLTIASESKTRLELSAHLRSGLDYQLQQSDSLLHSTWNNVGAWRSGTNSPFAVTIEKDAAKRFFRLIMRQP